MSNFMSKLVPEKARQFAVEVVRRLREADFEAYWAGGCVRDMLLDRQPKDYDVATDARPPEIRTLFGHRRTIAIGAAFGVITVLGPKNAGQIEVATFRQDDAYSDGRRPDSVRFSSAKEDAFRRDFTINGLFFDPLNEQIIDYVDGRKDIERRLIRAIGSPRDRFEEDKLRLMRAVRFAATFDFSLDESTRSAVCEMADQITVVSPERIAAEMERMLVSIRRTRAVRLVCETGLAHAILPEIIPTDAASQARLEQTFRELDALSEARFPLALGLLLARFLTADAARAVCRRWRLSNQQTSRVGWLVEHQTDLEDVQTARWSAVQPLLVHEGIDDLLALCEARASSGAFSPADAAWCREQLTRDRADLDPPPLINGDDLIAHGIRPGPRYRELLERIRNAQLDGQIDTPKEAITLADSLVFNGNE